MQRIDVSSASPTLPTPAALGTPGYFTDGDPIASTPATVVDADWLNLVQEELMGVVVGAGLAPSKTNHAQLLAAILKLILGNSANVAAGKGRIDLAGGLLVVQWGLTATPLGGATAADLAVSDTFFSAFPTACFGILGTAQGPLHASWGPVTVIFPKAQQSKTGFTMQIDTTDPNTYITLTNSVFWIALGN